MKKKMITVLLAAALTAALVGCGGQADEQAAGGQPVNEQEADAQSTDEQAAEEEQPSKEQNKKVWVVATDTAFRPFEYTDANGDFVGIDVDILAAVAEDQGFEYDLQSIGWDAGIAAVQVGQADALMAGATINDERKEMGWIFSDGYYDATQSFFVAADSDITSLEDLEGKNVVVKIGSASKTYAESIMDQYGFTITTMETSTDMYQDVINGNSAACVDDTPITLAYITLDGVGLKQLVCEGAESDSAPYGFAIMDGANQELLDMFNAGLANIKENGTYQEILDKYLK